MTLDDLRAAGITRMRVHYSDLLGTTRVWRTDRDGSIVWETDGISAKITTVRQPPWPLSLVLE